MISCITEEKTAKLKGLLGAARKVAIATHTHPDGDAIGSVTALALYLQRVWGKEVVCMLPDPLPDSLAFVKNPSVRYITGHTEEADLMIQLDCNAFYRTESLSEALSASKAPKVLIDHHLNPDEAS